MGGPKKYPLGGAITWHCAVECLVSVTNCVIYIVSLLLNYEYDDIVGVVLRQGKQHFYVLILLLLAYWGRGGGGGARTPSLRVRVGVRVRPRVRVRAYRKLGGPEPDTSAINSNSVYFVLRYIKVKHKRKQK